MNEELNISDLKDSYAKLQGLIRQVEAVRNAQLEENYEMSMWHLGKMHEHFTQAQKACRRQAEIVGIDLEDCEEDDDEEIPY